MQYSVKKNYAHATWKIGLDCSSIGCTMCVCGSLSGLVAIMHFNTFQSFLVHNWMNVEDCEPLNQHHQQTNISDKQRNTTTIIYHVIRFCRRHITIISFSAISRNLVTLRAAASEIGLRNSQEPKWKHTHLHTHTRSSICMQIYGFFSILIFTLIAQESCVIEIYIGNRNVKDPPTNCWWRCCSWRCAYDSRNNKFTFLLGHRDDDVL